MSKPLAFLSLLCFVVLAGLPVHGESPIGVPITVDGELTVAEWRQGADQPVDGEGWARIEHRNDGLYLAVRSNFVAMVDVMVQRGDTLHQLHVSGQVGGALFERGDDDLWRLTQTYPWLGEIRSQKAFEAYRGEKRAALRRRLAALGAEKKGPNKEEPTLPTAGSTGEPASQAPVTAPSSSSAMPTPPTPRAAGPAPPPKATADPAALAEHLEEHGWTGTQSSHPSSKTAELFLSNDFLRPGDRLLVMWPHRAADRSLTTQSFPAAAAAMPEGHSAAHSTEPFTHDFSNWYVFAANDAE